MGVLIAIDGDENESRVGGVKFYFCLDNRGKTKSLTWPKKIRSFVITST